MNINQIKQSDLKEAQVHFGDLTRRLNSHMKPYVYVKSAKICIFDLAKIISSCRKLPIYLEKILTREKNILFLATKKSTRKLVREQAIGCKMPFIVNK
jgi:small subunit ribosomal protein S2